MKRSRISHLECKKSWNLFYEILYVKMGNNSYKSGPIKLVICDNYIRTSINLIQSNWRYATTIRTSINLVQSNWRYDSCLVLPYGDSYIVVAYRQFDWTRFMEVRIVVAYRQFDWIRFMEVRI
jgi:hypothetical protein